jgi:broad specificity phosphatase PhoE
MAELYLVRHGQASLGSADYDRLTETGARQSRWLGEYYSERGLAFHAVFTGSQRRHAETLDALAEALPGMPEPRALPGLDEYDFGALIRATTGAASLQEAIAQSPEGDRRAIYALLRGALEAWASGGIDGDLPESWAVFGQRVGAALAEISAAAGRGQRVLVVCSGGPISRLLGLALELADRTTIGLNLQMQNSAFAHLYHDGESYQLASFNSLPHLDRPERRAAMTHI